MNNSGVLFGVNASILAIDICAAFVAAANGNMPCALAFGGLGVLNATMAALTAKEALKVPASDVTLGVASPGP